MPMCAGRWASCGPAVQLAAVLAAAAAAAAPEGSVAAAPGPRQLRGEARPEARNATLGLQVPAGWGGSCRDYGCGRYIQAFSCQCNSKCRKFGNCCGDYKAWCEAPPVPAPAPAGPVPPPPGPGDLPYGHPTPGKAYPERPGFTLWFVEEFDAPLDLDTDPVWTWSDGGLSEGQVRFAKEQLRFQGGRMQVVADVKRGAGAQPCSHAEKAILGRHPLVSGELRTRHNQFRYGRYEVRMKAPSVQPGNPNVNGNFIATMFVYKDAKFEHWREIDIEVTGDGPGAITTNVLSADNTRFWNPTIADVRSHDVPGINARAEFHTYAFEWLPDRITWYVDDQKVREQVPGQVRVPDMAGKIMMNLWIFSDVAGFGGKEIHNNRYPMQSEYDWFRFYKWDGDASYPCPGLVDSCLTARDQYLSSNNPCDGKPMAGAVYGDRPCHGVC